MTMNTRRRERGERSTASLPAPSASGKASKTGRRRSIGFEDEEMQLITLSLPRDFVKDLKLAAAARDLTHSAFVYQQCVDAVVESLDNLAKDTEIRSRKYKSGSRAK